MPNTKSAIIFIRNETESQGSNNFAVPNGTQGSGGVNAGGSGSGAGKGGKAQTATIEMFAVQRVVSPVVKAAISYARSHVNMYTGSQDLQDKINFAFELAGDAGTIAGGAIAGSAFGPVGAAVGAIGGAITVGIKYAQRGAEYSYNRSWDSVNTGVQQGRAGPSFNKSRIGG
jgi:hypothetical protein